ncbi:MAG TPA: hypothetical protein PK856_02925, partial [Vitreoscilla sp.]|nr:hypothetical protein [Vitreoscilla sp.]
MKNLFSHIVLICSLVYTFFVFSGYNIGWGHFPYDEWRLLANSLLVIIVCIALKPEIWICNVVIVRLIGPLVILFIIVIIYILFIPKQINSISFLLVYSLLYFAIFIYSFVFQINRSKEFYLIILSCMPLLTVMWLPIESILMYMFPEEIASKAWLGNFLNKRQYDDAILPFLFILALLKVPKNFEIFRWALWVLILSGSIQNGSRAVIFSLIFGLIFAAIWYRSYRWSRIFIIGTISAVLLALVFTFLQNQPALTALQRIDDSGRGH